MMKVLYFLIVVAFLGFGNLSGQENYTHEFGKVTNYEMVTTAYPDDPDAEAFYIYEQGQYSFITDYNEGFKLRLEFRSKIKILKPAGLRYATVEIPLYLSSDRIEKMEELEGITYNVQDGQLLKSPLDTRKVYEEKINSNWVVKKFAMPDVKEGSVAEIKYTIITPFLFQMRPWYFQHRIPVKHSLLTCRMIPYYAYAFILRGAGKFDIHNEKDLSREMQFRNLKYREKETEYGMENVPAFRDEEFISSPNDYRMGIDFQLATIALPGGGKKDILSTWPALCKEFIKSAEFGKYVDAARKEGAKILKELPVDGKSDLEKAKIITAYVKGMYNWNGRLGKYATQKVPEFMQQKTGNDADLNLFLTGLLRAAGLEAYPVLLSTRSNGVIYKMYPFESMLNYVVAMVSVDGTTYHIDATEPLRYFDALPTRCIHVDGLVVKEGKEEMWTYLEDKDITLVRHEINMRIDTENRLATIEARLLADGHAGVHFRALSFSGKDRLTEHLRKKYDLPDVKGVETEFQTEIVRPVEISFHYETEIEGTAEKLFINPFAGLAIKDNPFRQNSRHWPVDMIYVVEEQMETVIEIPEGYKVTLIPQNRVFKNQLLDMLYEIEEQEDRLIIKGKLAYQSALYPAEYYEALKHQMTAIIARFGDRIVLEKDS